jgi:hypothetical protein
LLRTIRIPKENILKLTCSVSINNNNNITGNKPLENPEEWLTYENIIAKFNEIIKNAKPGDQIYFHYSAMEDA